MLLSQEQRSYTYIDFEGLEGAPGKPVTRNNSSISATHQELEGLAVWACV